MSAITHRYDFVYLFDVTNGNPNGDPDAGNLPRADPETNRGLVTDVCLKRKIRNYVAMKENGQAPNAIFIQEKSPLNLRIAEAARAQNLPDFTKPGGWDTQKAKTRSAKDVRLIQNWLCERYFDIRAFGGVLSTGPNAGQIRGPVQFTFAQSIEPITVLETAITRVTDVDKEEGEMGRKHIVPYGLYRAHGFISGRLANDVTKGTGFSDKDLALFWQALEEMFEHDRSAARGEMTKRRLIIFTHESDLGNAPAHKLFDRVTVKRRIDGRTMTVDEAAKAGAPPARAFSDYDVHIDDANLPPGITVDVRL